MEGIVKKVIQDRGFGFITGDDGKDVFFHISKTEPGVFDVLKEGQRVAFDLEAQAKSPKGPRAVNVRMA